ncbi:MAG: oligosaccharide flippase family protein [Candidatus Paceibacterota bacterium]
MDRAKRYIKQWLRWSERYTKTDMVYVASGSFWVAVRSGGVMVISLGSMTAFAHLATQELYGEYQYVLSMIGLMFIFGLPGMKSALVRSVARGYEGSLSAASKETFLWSGMATLVLGGVSGWYVFQGNTELGAVFALAALAFPLKGAVQLFVQHWEGRQQFGVWSISYIVFQFVTMGSVVTALFFTDSLVTIFALFFGAQIIAGSALYIVAVRSRKNNDVDPGLISFSRHLSVMSVLGTIAGRIDRIILWHFMGPIDLAVYSFARDPVNKVQGALPIQTLALPKLSRNRVDSPGRKKKVFQKIIMLFAVTVPLAGVVALGAPFVYAILFPQYTEAVQYIPLLTVPIMLLPLSILGSSLTAEMKTQSMYITRTVVPIVTIVLFLILVPLAGIWGVIFSVIISQVLSHMLSLYFFWRM